MRKYIFRSAILYFLLLSIALPATTQSSEYKAGKWSNIADSHWTLFVTAKSDKRRTTEIDILIFGETVVLKIKNRCEVTVPTEMRTVMFRSDSPLVAIYGCLNNDLEYADIVAFKEQIAASDIPTDVLNMLSQLKWWVETK